MDKIIDKISAYNIFTNLFPGVMYCFFSEKFFGIPLIQDDLLVAVFLYYFTGMVISRVSSVVLEPILKVAKFVKFADYKKYIAASTKDEQIGILLETSNSCRSVIALLLCILATGAWRAIAFEHPIVSVHSNYILIIVLLALFLFAYRKQTQDIVARNSRHESREDSTPGLYRQSKQDSEHMS